MITKARKCLLHRDTRILLSHKIFEFDTAKNFEGKTAVAG